MTIVVVWDEVRGTVGCEYLRVCVGVEAGFSQTWFCAVANAEVAMDTTLLAFGGHMTWNESILENGAEIGPFSGMMHVVGSLRSDCDFVECVRMEPERMTEVCAETRILPNGGSRDLIPGFMGD